MIYASNLAARTGQVYGHHGGRALRLNVDAGPLQVELVRDPGAQKILVVADEGGDVLLGEAAVQPDVREIGVQGGSAEHADASLPAIRVIPGVLERLIGQFQQEPVLWIHRLGFHRREAEESCVKTARLLQDRRGFYVARVAEIGWRHARFQDLLIGKPSNRLDACGQVTPELVDVARAW